MDRGLPTIEAHGSTKKLAADNGAEAVVVVVVDLGNVPSCLEVVASPEWPGVRLGPAERLSEQAVATSAKQVSASRVLHVLAALWQHFTSPASH